jgi:hypothetical protein
LHGGEDGDGEIPVMKQRKGLRKQKADTNPEFRNKYSTK